LQNIVLQDCTQFHFYHIRSGILIGVNYATDNSENMSCKERMMTFYNHTRVNIELPSQMNQLKET
jgi:hypothetical protein